MGWELKLIMSPYVNVSSRTAGDASGKEHNHVLEISGDLLKRLSDPRKGQEV